VTTATARHLELVDGDEQPRPAYTDLGNAELFVREHGDTFRWVAENRSWLVWHRDRWRPDVTHAVERAAKQTVKAMLNQAAAIDNDDDRAKAAKWASTSQGEAKISALIALARTERPIVVTARDLDAHPYLLSCANGTLVPYDPKAKCRRFERFLKEVFASDAELIAFLQRLIGYCLTGDIREHLIVVLHGAGCNGKSTLLEVLKQLLGDLAATAPFDTFTRSRGDRGPRNDLARLRGARLVTASESGEGRRLDEAILKEITGGDTIAARFLYGEHFEFQPNFKLLLTTNHRPRVDGDDDAVWRRLRLVPFDESFEGREDHTLGEQLRNELPGILAWAVRGCAEWQLEGLGNAGAVTRATTEYRTEEDTLGAFLTERCTHADEVTATDLRAAYEDWCRELGERPVTSVALGKRLARRGIKSRRGAKGARIYTGISLNPGVTGARSDSENGNSPLAPARNPLSDSSLTTRHPSPDKDRA
jgi:putative DNA primase/helicase